MSRRHRLLTIGLLAVSLGLVRADDQKLATDGTLHRLEVETLTSPQGKTLGTALRHIRQKPYGGRESSMVPGTEDPAVDQEPAVEFDGGSGQIIAVWSRWDGASFQIHGARFDSGAWSIPALLFRLDGDQREPQVRVDDAYIHVVSRRDGNGGPTYYRTSYRRGTFELAYGPELLPPGASGAVADSTALGPDPSGCGTYFGAPLPGRFAGEPPHVVVWGVRDEPVPIGYCQVFHVPLDAVNPSQVEARWIHGKFAVFFVSGERFYYAVRRAGVWSEFRVIELNAATTASDAKRLMAEMLRVSP